MAGVRIGTRMGTPAGAENPDRVCREFLLIVISHRNRYTYMTIRGGGESRLQAAGGKPNPKTERPMTESLLVNPENRPPAKHVKALNVALVDNVPESRALLKAALRSINFIDTIRETGSPGNLPQILSETPVNIIIIEEHQVVTGSLGHSQVCRGGSLQTLAQGYQGDGSTRAQIFIIRDARTERIYQDQLNVGIALIGHGLKGLL